MRFGASERPSMCWSGRDLSLTLSATCRRLQPIFSRRAENFTKDIMGNSFPAKDWLVKAERDLRAAIWLSQAPDPLLDSAVYHLQRGAEKALKGFLVFHQQPISKTHNLVVLTLQAADLDTDLLAWRAQVTGLTPYASEFRYPDSRLEPTPEEFEEALTAAQNLYTFVLSKLPAASHP